MKWWVKIKLCSFFKKDYNFGDISIRPPKKNAETYTGRKHEYTMNLFSICNFDMNFTYAYVSVSGNKYDTKVLTYYVRNEIFFHFR